MTGRTSTFIFHPQINQQIKSTRTTTAANDNHSTSQIMTSHKSEKRSSKHIDFENNFKLIVVGDSGVGKSSFLSQYTQSTFNPTFNTTIGVDYDFCHVTMPDDTKVRLQIWDTAGQERFRAITMSFYRQSRGIFLVYDCCDMSSLEHAKNIWLPDIRKYANKDAKIVLIGNKLDNVEVARKKGIDTQAIQTEARKFAEQQGIQLIETSAKQDDQVDKAFLSMAMKLKTQTLSRQTTQKVHQKTLHIDYPDRPRSIFAKLCNLLDTGSKRRRARGVRR